LIVV
jgi:hypothetical protein